MPGKRKRQAYDNAFKIRVIEFAENLNNNSAAEGEFGISEKLVRDWRKNKDTINTKSITGVFKKSTATVTSVCSLNLTRSTSDHAKVGTETDCVVTSSTQVQTIDATKSAI
ncbi:hypothetical protein DPMN_128820 [Dreissena polymorpha]|uniref:Brinker DNA-binding domain-containing protein n=1 Tax=Dreissena polymorpha TaxID=45954 RepID=A0A9D4K0I2_DREPO|nr:hypothetical protein DPMN_128820 [Dreissena polymorpha]